MKVYPSQTKTVITVVGELGNKKEGSASLIAKMFIFLNKCNFRHTPSVFLSSSDPVENLTDFLPLLVLGLESSSVLFGDSPSKAFFLSGPFFPLSLEEKKLLTKLLRHTQQLHAYSNVFKAFVCFFQQLYNFSVDSKNVFALKFVILSVFQYLILAGLFFHICRGFSLDVS